MKDFKETSPVVYIIIISHNCKKALIDLLDSVARSTYQYKKVVVVDNDSKDGTVAAVKEKFPTFDIVVNASNMGFGKGCNIGIRRALAEGADFILLLNQDTIIEKKMIQKLVDFSVSKPRAACIGSKTYFLDPKEGGGNRILYAGAWRRWLPMQQKVIGIEEMDIGQYDLPCLVDYAWGHGMFIRMRVLKQIGFFDPNLFMYYEDLDLCIRMRKAGHEIWYLPAAVMWHEIPDGARASASELWRWRLKTESIHFVHRKHYGIVKGFLWDVAFFFKETLQLLRFGYLKAAKHRLIAFLEQLF